jgi:hypothetical protein
MGITAMIMGWRERLTAGAELQLLGADGRQGIARELGVAEGLLAALAARGRQSAAELPRMMRALALDPEEVGRRRPRVLRDLEVTCSLCRHTARCRRDLDAGRALVSFGAICPNKQTLTALRNERVDTGAR